ncbi:hypothetical protein C8255_22200 [filamentous cyanobacterium CCP3]|nr:hypothetical protein C8255_22200 [filamentous cyanobacterium CCP3]
MTNANPDDPCRPEPEGQAAPTSPTAVFSPGWLVLGIHRVAHSLYRRQIPLIPRLLSYLGRLLPTISP